VLILILETTGKFISNLTYLIFEGGLEVFKTLIQFFMINVLSLGFRLVLIIVDLSL